MISLNCFSRDPSESPDDVTEIVINSSNVSGAGKVKPRAQQSRVHPSDSEGYELSKEEQKKIRKMRRKERKEEKEFLER